MKTKALKKALSVILSLTMFVTMFTCLTLVVTAPMTASAINAANMVHVDNNKVGYISYQWRPGEYTDMIKPNTDYRLTFYWENISNASIFTNAMFYVKYYDGTAGSWKVLLKASDMTAGDATGKSMKLTDLNHGQLVTIDFTSPANCRDGGSICFLFGDWDWALGGSSVIFNLAEIKLYTRSGDSLTEVSMGDITSNTTLGTCSNSTPTGTRGQIMRNTTRGDGSEITFPSISSGYFDEPSTDKVHFEKVRNNYSRYLFKVGYMTYPAGKYVCTMDCKIFGGSPLIRVTTDADIDGNYFPLSGNELNYTATYDDVNYKYTITFDTASDLSTPFGLIVGNYGHTGNFVFANPTLYRVDSEGNPLSYNYLKPLISDYYVTSLASGKWCRKGNYLSSSQSSHYFDREDTTNYMTHFPAGEDGYQVLVYKDTGLYLNSGETYRLMVDVNSRGTGTPSVVFKNGSYDSDSVLGAHTVSGYTWTYDFTLEHNSAAGYQIMLGNYGAGTDVDAVFKNLRLYKIEDGVIAGANMVAPFKSANYEQRSWGATRAQANSGKYTPVNCTASRINVTAVDNDYFPSSAPTTTGTAKMANVYYGSSWNTFIYNDVSLPLQKGHTYQFISDVKVTSGSPTVNIYESYASANNNINSATYTSSYTDTTSGNTRTVTFTMARTVSIVRIRIGNYSDNTDVAGSFGNVRLVESGSNTNLIAGLSSNTLQSSAGNRKWQIANSSNASYYYTHEARDIPAGYFEGTAPSNMYYISGVTTAYQGLNPSIKLKASTTYRLDFDWKTYGGAYPKVSITGYNGSDWVSISQTAVNPDNKMDGTYTALTSNLLPSSVMNTSRNGHYAVTFTTPADLGTSTTRNVQFLFAN